MYGGSKGCSTTDHTRAWPFDDMFSGCSQSSVSPNPAPLSLGPLVDAQRGLAEDPVLVLLGEERDQLGHDQVLEPVAWPRATEFQTSWPAQ